MREGITLIEFEFEPIYDILKRIEEHPELIMKIKSPYKNVVQVFIPDTTKVEHANFYFPAHKLMVNRLPKSFTKLHPNLFSDYWEATGKSQPSYTDIWATTAHLSEENAYLIELSFE